MSAAKPYILKAVKVSKLPDVTYLHRVVDDEPAAALRRDGAVLIEGPKACGKTLTASQVARTTVLLDEQSEPVQQALGVDPIC